MEPQIATVGSDASLSEPDFADLGSVSEEVDGGSSRRAFNRTWRPGQVVSPIIQHENYSFFDTSLKNRHAASVLEDALGSLICSVAARFGRRQEVIEHKANALQQALQALEARALTQKGEQEMIKIHQEHQNMIKIHQEHQNMNEIFRQLLQLLLKIRESQQGVIHNIR